MRQPRRMDTLRQRRDRSSFKEEIDDTEKEDGDDEAKDADDSGDADTDADEEDFNPEDIFKGL